MIVTKTPLRVSFFGGSSDIPAFYENHGEGVCVSTTINSYIYLAVNKCVAPHLKVIYSELEHTNDVNQIKHNRVRETLKYFNLTSNIEICSFSDMTTKGTGLGSSSTFTVGLINALSRIYSNEEMDKWSLADLACHIEIDKCKEPIGKQDQYAAAYGGLNEYTFTDTEVYVEPIQVTRYTLNSLNNKLYFFNTGIVRNASSVLENQVDSLKKNINVDDTKQIVDMARTSIKFLYKNKLNDFGSLLHDSWQIKKKLTNNITNDTIDEMYEAGMNAGALGGKLLGAGGGGYLMLYVPDHRKSDVLHALRNYQCSRFLFTKQGSSVEMKS